MRIQKTFKNKLPTIYVVGTPIGNLDDISFRAVEILKSVDYILCEDTRTSSVLLNKLNVKNQLISLHKFNEIERVATVVEKIGSNKNIAIISDAGIPGISDPGMLLIEHLLTKDNLDFNVSAVNCGPAYIHNLVSQGFNVHSNIFLGFLDRKKNKQKDYLLSLINAINKDKEKIAVSFYESVHRIESTINNLDEIFGQNYIIGIGREITKINEEYIQGKSNEIIEFFQNEAAIKGEFVVTILIEPIEKNDIDEDTVVDLLNKEIDSGKTPKEAISSLSKSLKLNKNSIYKIYLNNK